MNNLKSYEKIGEVYIIHFDKKYKHCQHYIGFTTIGVKNRIAKHKAGNGAALLRALNTHGVSYNVSVIFPNVPQEFEFKLKSWKNSKKICPICKYNKKA